LPSLWAPALARRGSLGGEIFGAVVSALSSRIGKAAGVPFAPYLVVEHSDLFKDFVRVILEELSKVYAAVDDRSEAARQAWASPQYSRRPPPR